MRCAVQKCKQSSSRKPTSGKSVSFYCFPKDSARRKLWIKFCNRVNTVNAQNERICALHFKQEDFERNLKFEMGFSNRYALKLKPGAVPTIETTVIANEKPTTGEKNIPITTDNKDSLQLYIKTLEMEIGLNRRHKSVRDKEKGAFTCELCHTNLKSEKSLEVHMLTHTNDEVPIKEIAHQNNIIGENNCNEFFEIQVKTEENECKELLIFQCADCPKCFDKNVLPSAHHNACKKNDSFYRNFELNTKDNILNSTDEFQQKTNESMESVLTVIVKEEIEIPEQTYEEFVECFDGDAKAIDNYYKNSNDKLEKELFTKPRKTTNDFLDINTGEVEKPRSSKKRCDNFPCKECGVLFKSSYLLKRHSSAVHSIASEVKENLVHSPTKTYACDICQYHFPTANILKSHLYEHKHVTKKHSKAEKHKCSQCDETFDLHANLVEHLNRHNKDNKNLVCPICGKKCLHKSSMREHMCKHRQYLCTLCGKIFRFSNSYRQHIKIHTGLIKYQCSESLKNRKQRNGKLTCETCGKVLHHLSELKKHLSSVHSLMRPHRCKFCKYRFIAASLLRAHLSQHKYEGRNGIFRQVGIKRSYYSTRFKKQALLSADHQMHTHNTLENNYTCMECQRKFKSVRALTIHITKIHPEVEKHKCDQCNKTFVLHSQLVEHLNRHKGYEVEKPKSTKRSGNYPCETCGKVFSHLYLLKQHGAAHSPTKPHECGICKYRFNTAQILKAHLSQHKNGKRGYSYQSRPEGFKCPDCPRRFERLASLASHRRTHTHSNSEANYICAVCQQNFMSIKTLTRHVINKHPEEKYKCEQCDKTFVLHAQLQSHLNRHKKDTSTHTDESRHLCNRCGKTFRSNKNLEEHMRNHSGENPYLCSQCGKTFRCSTNFSDHMRTHSGENPYLCPQCGKTFYYSSNFRQHMKRHTGLRKYQCPECPSRYSRRSDLIRHAKSAKYHTKVVNIEKPHNINGKLLDVHKVNDNEGEEVESKNTKKIFTFQCPDCPKCFEKQASLSSHYKIHTKEDLFINSKRNNMSKRLTH